MYQKKKSYLIFKDIFSKIPGSMLGICSGGIFFTTIFISIILYYINDNSFSIFTHFISNLGVGPNFSSFLFNNGLKITSCLIIMFHIYQYHNLRKIGVKIKILFPLLVTALIYSTGLYVIAAFPMNLEIHGVAASFYFIGCLLHYLIYSYILYNLKEFSLLDIIISLLLIQIFILFISTQIYTAFTRLYLFGISNHILEWCCCFLHLLVIIKSSFSPKNFK
jgi:hypothetical membrane protein